MEYSAVFWLFYFRSDYFKFFMHIFV